MLRSIDELEDKVKRLFKKVSDMEEDNLKKQIKR